MAHGGYGPQWPQTAATDPAAAGRVHRWFVLYVVAMLVLYLLCCIASTFALLYDFDVTPDEAVEIRIYAVVFLAASAGMLVVFSVGLFLPRRSWGWVYGLVLIGLGLTSCCTWPITIPLVIQWLKPEVKGRFGAR